jgi:hypothetical protein
VPEKFPRLTITLQRARHPALCQSCGVSDQAVTLEVWREHDDRDRPEQVYLVLCPDCSRRLIEPHPRLYSRLRQHEPSPGVMPTCGDCRYRQGVRCSHPCLKANGGDGLLLRFPEPTTAHLYYGGGRGEWVKLYHGPVVCAGKEVADA